MFPIETRSVFKQLFRAGAIRLCQVDGCRLGGVNEVLAVLLMAAKLCVPVCPHTGGAGLPEYMQHILLFDYVCVSAKGLFKINRINWKPKGLLTTHGIEIEHISIPARFLNDPVFGERNLMRQEVACRLTLAMRTPCSPYVAGFRSTGNLQRARGSSAIHAAITEPEQGRRGVEAQRVSPQQTTTQKDT
jgi:hypothetical protein